MKIKVMHYSMIGVYSLLIILMIKKNSIESVKVSQVIPVNSYEKPVDWAEDSTMSDEKKQYCEYLFNEE